MSISDSNLSVATGQVHRPAEKFVLPSGSEVWNFDIAVREEGLRQDTFTIAWHGDASVVERLEPGDRVLVRGRTQRRWRQAGGTRISTTELVASAVVSLRSTKRVQQQLRLASDELTDLAG